MYHVHEWIVKLRSYDDDAMNKFNVMTYASFMNEEYACEFYEEHDMYDSYEAIMPMYVLVCVP